MRRTVTIVCVCLFALALSPAFARAEGPSALERLTVEERAQLEAKVAGWAALSAERKEKIARIVIRFREMPEEKRQELLERIQRLKRGREAGRGPRPGRLGHHLDPRRAPERRQRGHAMRAVGAILWAELPETTRTALEGSLQKRDRERVEVAFFRRLVGRIAEQRAKDGVPPIVLPPEHPPEWPKNLEELREKAEAGDEGALKRLAHISVVHDLRRATGALGRDGPPDEAAVRRLGARVREGYPAAFAASVAELAEAAESEASLRRYAPPSRGRHARSPEHQARRLLEALEQSGDLLRRHAELKEHVRKLKRALRKIVGDGPAPEARGPDREGPDRDGPGRRPGFPGGRRGPGGGAGPRRAPPDAPPPPDDDEDR